MTTYDYDRAGRLAEKAREGRSTTYAYDAFGRQNQITIGDTIYKTEYDLLDRPIAESTLGRNGTLYRLEKYSYDKYGNRSQIIRNIDGKEAIDKLAYDGFGRLRSHTDALGHVTKTQYKEKDVLIKIVTDPNGIKTKSTYNPLGQMVLYQRLQDKELSRTEYTYSPHGDLLEKTQTVYPSKKKIKTSWTYDSMHRPLTLNEAGLRLTKTGYTPNGLKAQITKPDGTELCYSYDALNHLATLASSDGSIDYAYSHDKLGNLIKCRDNVKNIATTRSYDAFGNLTHENLANGLAVSSKYDTNGRKISLTYPDGSTAHYTYEGPDLTKVTYKDQECIYTYDLSGNVTSCGASDLSYDVMGRLDTLISADHLYSVDEFDPVGNILEATTTFNEESSKSYEYDELNQLTNDNGSHFTFDSNYNRLSDDNGTYEIDDLNQIVDLRYDQNGNLLEYNGQTYTYDALDRLISVTENGTAQHYVYDGLHRRVSADGVLFYYDDKNEIGSTNHEKRVLANAKTAEIGATAFIELDDTVFTPLHDAHGNIIALKGPQDLEVYSYDAFGVHDLFRNPWRYQSKRTDPTGLVNFGRRYYIPELGRWLSTDPAGYTDTNNLYAFLQNNPLKHKDPYGEFVVSLTIIGAAITAEAVFGTIATGVGLAMAAYTGYKLAKCANEMLNNFCSTEKERNKNESGTWNPQDDECWQRMRESIEEQGDECNENQTNTDKKKKEPPFSGAELGNDPTKKPADGFRWKGRDPPGGRRGNWYNSATGESLHPDLDHPEPIGPHWDYFGPDGKVRIYLS